MNHAVLQPSEGECYYRYRKGTLDQTTQMFQVVFALRASTAYSVAKCYLQLSKAIGIGIRYEER